ncbi:hypothetical protein [Spirosoma pollinicola]|uniref:T9SS C-terminal target domain-containing protein n=1 Tax=Spirosoma pollinicola TaxID=2057025 RepID=A0A2K8Z913_9BACT|nr:hypothetical protein [Spirosoma pollinicola]AUD06348.1 hypothetical protein CWM47_33610 [Spirosoma pollinicola]
MDSCLLPSITPYSIIRWCIIWLFVISSAHLSAQPTKQWDKTFGGSGNDVLSITLPTADGGYLLCGVSYSSAGGDKTQPNWGEGDYWIVKIGKDGIKQWDKTFGTTDNDVFKSVIATPDGGYLLGGTAYAFLNGDKTKFGNMWLLKIDANGNKLWDKAYGGNSGFSDMISTADGGYLLGGTTASGIGGDKTQPSRGGYDYWIIKIDANGIKQWDKAFGGNQSDQLIKLVASVDGGYLLGGKSVSGINGDKTEPSRDGSTTFDYWIVKIDANGTKQWDKTYGGVSTDELSALITTPDGGYLLGGTSSSHSTGDKTQPSRGASDYWIVKIGKDGTKQWDKTFGGKYVESLGAVVSTPDGGYLIGGYSNSYSGGDLTDPGKSVPRISDFWLVKVNANGAKQWDKMYGGLSNEYLFTLVTTSDKGYLLGGTSASNIGVDKTQPSQGNNDYWIVKLIECTLPARCVSIISIVKTK